jgi:hypothetical protein
MGHPDAERVGRRERLCLFVTRTTSSGVTNMSDPHVSFELCHVFQLEDITDHPIVLFVVATVKKKNNRGTTDTEKKSTANEERNVLCKNSK